MADASTSLEILLQAKDQASKVLDDVKEKAGGMGKALGDVAKIAGGVFGGQAALDGVKALGGFLVDAAKGAAEDQAATDRLNKSLENYVKSSGIATEGTTDFGYAMDELKKDMEERIKAGQKLAFGDDDVRDSMQSLIAATGDYGEASKRQAAAMDLARGANIPLATATKMLGKLNEENIEVFKKMGIVIGENATEADALAAVQAKFGGQAETYAKSTAGQFEQAKIRMGELKETIGAAVLPVMTALMTFLVSTVIPGMEQFANLVGPILKGAFDIVAPVIKSFIDYLKFTVTEGDKMNDFLMNVPEPLRGVAKAMAEVALFIKDDLIPAIEKVIAVVKEHWPEIQVVIKFAADFVKTQIEGMIQVIEGIVAVVTGVIDLVSALWHGDWAAAWEAMKQIAEGTLDIFIGNIKRMFGSMPELLLQAGKDLIDGFIDGIKSKFDDVKGTLGDLTGKLTSWKGPPEKDRKILHPAGVLLMEGLTQGIVDGSGMVQSALSKVTADAKSLVVGIASSSAGTSGGRKGLSVIGGSTPVGTGIASYARGTDNVPQDGLAYLHAGEAVVPASQNRGGLTINFYGSVIDGEKAVAKIVRTIQGGGGSYGYATS